jgi:2-polyprenyl-3-methyl-5-hydroxy-6-metoxy-1,4-benzoquinol methylase
VTPAVSDASLNLEERCRESCGSSSAAIHRMVEAALIARDARGSLIDVGCGAGSLSHLLGSRFSSYCGLDALRYDGFPLELPLVRVNLDDPEWPVPEASADVVAAVETIEHVENPWAFVRALVRIVKPGGLVLVTTPNQLSVLSLATLAVKRRFSAFQDVHYPAHRTALLESDLRRVFAASRLESVAVEYSLHGRLPLSAWTYPHALARLFPSALSDNLLIVGRRSRD